MVVCVRSLGLSGIAGYEVRAECFLSGGLPAFDIVGLPDAAVREARERGYAVTLMGRRRYLPELASSNFNVRSFGERCAMNSPIQGTAADIIKLAMVNVDKRLKEEKLRAKLLLQVHDELIVECPEEIAEQVAQLVSREMQNVAQLDVPLTAEAKYGKSWYEAK